MTIGEILSILTAAVAFGGLIWQVRDLKERLTEFAATATRSERELVKLNAMLEGKIREANLVHGRLDDAVDDHEGRIRKLEEV